MMLSALPHREVTPKSWQGPSPNVKLEMQHCWPRQGNFALRVRASRGYVPPLRRNLLVKLDDPAPLTRLIDNGFVWPENAIAIAATQTDQHQNLRLDDDILRSVEAPKPSRARVAVPIPKDGYYQIDLIHPVSEPAAGTWATCSPW